MRTLARMWDLFALIITGLLMFSSNEDVPRSQRKAVGIGCLALLGLIFVLIFISLAVSH